MRFPAHNPLLPLLLLPLSLAHALATIHGQVAPSAALPNPATLPPTTSVTLSTAASHRRTLLRPDSSFAFASTPAGSYLLEIHAKGYVFPPMRVDVSRAGDVELHQTFRGNAWSNVGPRLASAAVPAVAAQSPFIVREGFSPLRMLLGNPMILIAIVSLLSIVVLPKVMDKLDPDFKKEWEEQQKKSPFAQAAAGGNPNPMAGFDVAGFLAGASSNSGSSAHQGSAKQRKN